MSYKLKVKIASLLFSVLAFSASLSANGSNLKSVNDSKSLSASEIKIDKDLEPYKGEISSFLTNEKDRLISAFKFSKRPFIGHWIADILMYPGANRVISKFVNTTSSSFESLYNQAEEFGVLRKSEIKTSDDLYVGAVLDNREDPKDSDPVIVCFGGNAHLSIELVLNMVKSGRKGEFICFDRPGYGKSPLGDNVLCEDLQRKYVDSAMNYVQETYPSRKIIVVGHSLGGFEASCALKNFGNKIFEAYLFAPASVKGAERSVLGVLGLTDLFVEIMAHYGESLLAWDSLDSMDNLVNVESSTKVYLCSGVPFYYSNTEKKYFGDFLSCYYTALEESEPLHDKPSDDVLRSFESKIETIMKERNENLNIVVKMFDCDHSGIDNMFSIMSF